MEKAVEKEHQRMIENNVWKSLTMKDVPKGANILTSAWACKLKANGDKQARINGCGYEQVYGIHYESASIHSLVTNDVSVCIVMVLGIMAD